MRLNKKSFKKSIAYVCLCIYLLFGFLNTSAMSICYGSEHFKHIGINVLGYEPCCSKEAKTQSAVNLPKDHQSSYQSRCNCVDEKIASDNQCQQSLKINSDNILAELNTINTQPPSFIVGFEEKHNKINWDIYSHKKFDNRLAIINAEILRI